MAASQLNAATSGGFLSGGGTSAGAQKTTTSLGQILDLYIVHFVVSLMVLIGGFILIGEYATSAAKPSSAWDDLFYAIGALTMALNIGFMAGLIVEWFRKNARAFTRQDEGSHWLHALSIFAAAFTTVWGILALALTFGNTLGSDTPVQREVAGFFLVLFAIIYCAYLVIRYLFGLAGKPDAGAAGAGIQGATTIDSNAALLAAIRGFSNTAPVSSAQPLFGGAGGAAAFGGIDLSGLQPSSMSTLPPTQAPSGSPYMMGCMPQQGYYPMMQPMMMAPQQMMGCNPDPNAVTLP